MLLPLLLLLIGMQRLCGRRMLLSISWQLAGALLTQLLLQVLLQLLLNSLDHHMLLLAVHPSVVLWQQATHSSRAQAWSAAEQGFH